MKTAMMKTYPVVFGCFLAVVTPTLARAQASAVLSVVTVTAKGDGSVYLEKLRAVKPVVMRMGASSYRVFRAAFAGEGANSIVSVAEYKDWATFAEARTRRAADKEYQKWYVDLVASNSSELVSISLLEEVTP
jgi:hypothetical protein